MNLLVTGAFTCTEYELNILRQLGHEIEFLGQEKEELPCEYSWVEGVIGNGIFLHHPIERFTSLKYIQLTSAGFDRVPMDYVEARGIKIHNARGVYSISMAEFTIGGVLGLYKKSRFFYDNQKDKKWIKRRDLKELNGKTVCIVGCGSVGTECAKRFSAFNCSVVGVDLFPRKDQNYQNIYPLDHLERVLPTADVVVLTLPLTNDTKHLMNQKRFGLMKEGSVLVNISRGAVVDEKAMIKALKERLDGGVLDVFEEEPLNENSELWGMDNVIITPHNSFVSEGNKERLFNEILKNLKVED